MQLVKHMHVRPDYDTCEWRLPWAELLRDVGNIASVSNAAHLGCIHALNKVADSICQDISQQRAAFHDALHPVLAGLPFSLKNVRKFLPFTAASRAKMTTKVHAYYFLTKATKVPMPILEMRRLESCDVLDANKFGFLRALRALHDPTAVDLLDHPCSAYLSKPAYHAIPRLRTQFGTSHHGWLYAKRLAKKTPHHCHGAAWLAICKKETSPLPRFHQ